MTKNLLTIKEELAWISKKYLTKITYKKHEIGEEIIHTISKGKNLKFVIRFAYYEKQELISCFYDIFFKKNKIETIHESYCLSDVQIDQTLPGINEEDTKALKDVLKYKVKDGIILSAISENTQIVTYVEILRRNLETMIVYAKSIEKRM